ncbi:L-type lectin-domain containing protein [Carnobacterium gallinarum]|uniref:L-type lectin-domain containing protein n=1 Tax=Carnobacterium gallinarum TaxID=2749 RepID=UPI0005550C8A|nr:L-type lectin-domain containing protein [Carnobacterium gallinarum]
MGKIGWFIVLSSVFLIFTIGTISAKAVNENNPPAQIELDNIFQTPAGSVSNIVTTTKGNLVEITPAKTNQNGAIWSTDANKMNLAEDFESSMYLYFGNQGKKAADGMTFVMQNDPNGPNAIITGYGSQIGTWASPTPESWYPGIRKSFAVEFDTYDNTDGFDADMVQGEDHIAWNFPDVRSSYVDYMSSNQVKRKLTHKNRQYPGELSVDKWFPFKIKWSASRKTLTYQFNDLAPVDVPIMNPEAVFGSTQVYWGFAGSTGNQTEMNRVSFEKVPDLVQSKVNLTVKNQEGISVDGGIVSSMERLTYRLEGNYISGKQEWKAVFAQLQLPENVTYIPNTLKLFSTDGSEIALPDDQWNEKTLNVNIGALNTQKNLAYVTFEVETANVSSLTEVTAEGLFTGKNQIDTSNRVDYQIDTKKPPTLTLTNENTIQTTVTGGNYEVTGIWKDLDGMKGTLHYLVNGKEVGTSNEISSTVNQEINYAYTIPGSSLTQGAENTLEVYAVDEDNLVSEYVSLKIKSLSVPKITLNHSDTTVNLDNTLDYTTMGTWQDLDSSWVSLSYVLDDSKAVEFAKEVSNSDPKDQEIKYELTVGGNGLTPGLHRLKVYAVDAEGQASVSKTVLINVTGTLQFTNVSDKVSYPKNEIPRTIKTIQRNKDWDIRVKDTRGIGSSWYVNVTVEQPFTNENKKKLTEGIIYKTGDFSTPLQVGVATTVFSKTTTDYHEVPVNWSENQGLLLLITPSDYSGSYQAVLNWTLIDGPS